MSPSPRSSMRRLAGLAMVVALGAATVGCGSSSDGAATTTTVRPAGSALTASDADRLAQMLFGNYRSGGADVAVSFDYSPEVSVRIEGVVDWVEHTGRLTVTSTYADGRPQDEQDVVFAEDAVYETPTPDQEAALAARERTGVTWIRRAPEQATRPLDQVIGLLISLAATRPDNPQLLAQDGTTFDRREDVDGRATDVFSTEKGTSYWVTVAGGRLRRVQANLNGFGGPVVIDLTAPGPQRVALPTGSTVADAADLTGP